MNFKINKRSYTVDKIQLFLKQNKISILFSIGLISVLSILYYIFVVPGYSKEVELTNLSKAQYFKTEIPFDPNRISIYISGNQDGTSELLLYVYSKNIRYDSHFPVIKIPKGNVNIHLNEDLYEKKLLVLFVPKTSKKGNLQIKVNINRF
jgi:hypothetical protein